jgi:glycogen debranching enzyme
MDGETSVSSGFVATFGREPYNLLFHLPKRRLLEIHLSLPSQPRLVTHDVVALQGEIGDLLMAYSAWHTLVGVLPFATEMRLRCEDGMRSYFHRPCWVSQDEDHGDVVVLNRREDRFVLAYGTSLEEALARVEAGIQLDVTEVARERLATYHKLPNLSSPEKNRLLKKAWSVMRVNTLSGEGVIPQAWSTPDRVPHRWMWLWDSVFHSLAMNHFNPALSWNFLKSVLDLQKPDGMIAHQMQPDGRTSSITQPPLLAWGVWENYRATRDKSVLEYALPRLERYLEWDIRERDQNHNGLLEWFIEGDVKCRSGESGLDNSPRFDQALIVDAVDFSTFAAQDMLYLGMIAAELGKGDVSRLWLERSSKISSQIHTDLWDEKDGFYYDRMLDGSWSQVAAVSGFFPLLLPDLLPRRVDRLLKWLQDPQQFAAAFPVPSVALSHPAWSTDLWRGGTWVNTNYLVIEGLRRHGRREEARDLAKKTIHYIMKYYEQYGVLFEFFDAKDKVPPPACDRKGKRIEPYDIRVKMDSIRDYHWTAALVACLLLEEKV